MSATEPGHSSNLDFLEALSIDSRSNTIVMTPEQIERRKQITDSLESGQVSLPDAAKQLEELYLEAAILGDIVVDEAARLLGRTERSVHNYVVQHSHTKEERRAILDELADEKIGISEAAQRTGLSRKRVTDLLTDLMIERVVDNKISAEVAARRLHLSVDIVNARSHHHKSWEGKSIEQIVDGFLSGKVHFYVAHSASKMDSSRFAELVSEKVKSGQVSVPDAAKRLEELYLREAVFGNMGVDEVARLLGKTKRSVHTYVVQQRRLQQGNGEDERPAQSNLMVAPEGYTPARLGPKDRTPIGSKAIQMDGADTQKPRISKLKF